MLTGLAGLLLKWIFPPLGTAIAGYVLAFLRKQLQKAGMELTAQQEAQIRELVQQVIRRIEEETAAAQKTRPETPPPSSDDKLADAITEIVERTGVAPGRARDLVHEELPKVRATSTWQPARTINPGLPGGGRR